MQGKRGDRVSMVGTLAVMMTLPLWPLASQVAGLRSVCVDIIELEFRPQPTDSWADDPLSLVQAEIPKGAQSICTDVDGYRKTVLEEQWDRITLLKVKLRDTDGTIITAVPSQERSPYDFYATTIREARVADWRQFLRETALTEGLILSLAGLAWCALRWHECRKQR